MVQEIGICKSSRTLADHVAQQLTSKYFMKFDFESDDQRIALEQNDVDVFPNLGVINQSRFFKKDDCPPKLCQGDISSSRSYQQFGTRPLTVGHLQAFHSSLDPMVGFWSVSWLSNRRDLKDPVYDDDFRCVVALGDIELAIRPVQAQDGRQVWRICLGPGDVQDCLNAARVVVEAKSEYSISVVTGQGSTMNREGRAKYPTGPWQPNIDFEWKLAPSPEDNLVDRVQKWRYEVCGGGIAYQKLERLYLHFLHENELDDPRMGMRKSLKGSRGRHQRKFHSHYQPEKRSAEQMDASEELGVRSKRLSMDSQPESVPSSTLMSPDISLQDTVAGWDRPLMGPLPPEKMERQMSGITRASRGSRGCTGSATAPVTAGFGALTVQSPALAPPQGMPPFEGSTWDGPSGTTGAGPAQFGGRYEPPNQGQRAPGRGQLTEVYGHLQYVEPIRPRGPQVGIEHTQFRGGGWNPPQPSWQQRAPADQAAVHRSNPPAQRAHSGSGHNMPVPSPNVQVGWSYPPSFPSAEPAMHGRGTHLPPQPRHMVMFPPLGGNAPSIFADMPMAESPQLYSEEPQFGQENIPPRVPPNVSPILQSLPPPVMDDSDLSQLQAPTTVPPVGEHYPLSVPSTTESLHAGLIASPEHVYAPAGSESYGGQEEPTGDEDSDSEDEDSDGEDDQFSHQDISAVEGPLYPGDYDNGRFYHSPLPSGGRQPVQQDPYWGGNESEDESGQD